MAQVIRENGQRAGSARLIEERGDGTIVVEADAAEEAVRHAREHLGDDAEIIEVHRLERGGVRGFFAREYFRLIAGPARRILDPAVVTPPPPAAGPRPEVDALVRQLGEVEVASPAETTVEPDAAPGPEPTAIGHAVGQVESEEEAFGTMLRRELHARGITPSAGEPIDLTERRAGAAQGPVAVGPAAGARPLRPTGSTADSLPPPPVPPTEPFRIDQEPSRSNGRSLRVAPEPTPPGAGAGVSRPVTRGTRTVPPAAVVVDSDAQPRRAPAPATERATPPPTVEVSPPVPPLESVEMTPATVSAAVPSPEPDVVSGAVAEGDGFVEPSAADAAPGPTIDLTDGAVESAAVIEASVTASSGPVPTTAVVGAASTPVPDTPPGLGAVRWSVDRLAHLGLPFELVRRTVDLDPSDDQRWLLTLADGLAPFVRPEPAGSAVFAGPRADRIGAAMELPVVEAPELPPYGGSVALKTTDDGAGRAWLARVRGDRVLHVVVGGRGWELLLEK
ncbi:MAG: hypothetical protein AAGF02_18675, partial [Actinomycetota bacterium]